MVVPQDAESARPTSSQQTKRTLVCKSHNEVMRTEGSETMQDLPLNKSRETLRITTERAMANTGSLSSRLNSSQNDRKASYKTRVKSTHKPVPIKAVDIGKVQPTKEAAEPFYGPATLISLSQKQNLQTRKHVLANTPSFSFIANPNNVKKSRHDDLPYSGIISLRARSVELKKSVELIPSLPKLKPESSTLRKEMVKTFKIYQGKVANVNDFKTLIKNLSNKQLSSSTLSTSRIVVRHSRSNSQNIDKRSNIPKSRSIHAVKHLGQSVISNKRDDSTLR